MKNLKELDLSSIESHNMSQECYQEALRLLKQRCIEELSLGVPYPGSMGNVFKTLMESKCALNHQQCSKLTKLVLICDYFTDDLLSMCEFFRYGHAICLKELHLSIGFSSIRSIKFITSLCEVLDNSQCPELTCLDLQPDIDDEGVTKLCRTLNTKQMLKLTKLDISRCSLTNKCLPALCELLRNEHCILVDLNLRGNNGIKDEGFRILCEDALTNEHCKLERLDLSASYFTLDSLPLLYKTLRDEHCKLTFLALNLNTITDKGVHTLCELALTKEDCKLECLLLQDCSLTDECIPDLLKTVQDEHCRLNELHLYNNKFTEEGKKSIREIQTHEHCKGRGLKILSDWQYGSPRP